MNNEKCQLQKVLMHPDSCNNRAKSLENTSKFKDVSCIIHWQRCHYQTGEYNRLLCLFSNSNSQ